MDTITAKRQLARTKTGRRRSAMGAFIMRRRKELGMSQDELAALVGVSAAAVGFWEAGTTRPTRQGMKQRLARALRVDVADFPRAPRRYRKRVQQAATPQPTDKPSQEFMEFLHRAVPENAADQKRVYSEIAQLAVSIGDTDIALSAIAGLESHCCAV